MSIVVFMVAAFTQSFWSAVAILAFTIGWSMLFFDGLAKHRAMLDIPMPSWGDYVFSAAYANLIVILAARAARQAVVWFRKSQ